MSFCLSDRGSDAGRDDEILPGVAPRINGPDQATDQLHQIALRERLVARDFPRSADCGFAGKQLRFAWRLRQAGIPG